MTCPDRRQRPRFAHAAAIVLAACLPALARGQAALREGAPGDGASARASVLVVSDALVELGTAAVSSERRAELALLLREAPGPELRAVLDDLSRTGQPVGVRREALALLADVGAPADLGLSLRLACARAPSEVEPALPGPELERALARILGDDPGAHASMRSLVRRAEVQLLPHFGRGLGASGSGRALVALADLLALDPERGPLYLEEIERVARAAPAPHPRSVQNEVRTWIDHRSLAIRRSAVRAADALEDRECVPVLLELLHAQELSLAADAHGALQHISDLRFGRDPRRWDAWYQEEMAWWRTRSSAELELLHGGTSAERVAAVSSIVRRRLFRHELSGELARLALDADPAVRRLACQGLGQLRSPVGREVLVGRLTDHEASVAAAADLALAQIDRDHEEPAGR